MLRGAEPRDAKNIATIDVAASTYPWSETQLTAACTNAPSTEGNHFSENILLLESKAETCGFAVYCLVLDEGSILNIAVHPSWQGRGGARILLQGVLDLLYKSGARRCLLEVRASNVAARGLYDGYGFGLDGVRQNYYPTDNGREDALLMSKPLIQETDTRMPQ
jgi:ribosomal-protein-alanine N-acetyltransferase